MSGEQRRLDQCFSAIPMQVPKYISSSKQPTVQTQPLAQHANSTSYCPLTIPSLPSPLIPKHKQVASGRTHKTIFWCPESQVWHVLRDMAGIHLPLWAFSHTYPQSPGSHGSKWCVHDYPEESAQQLLCPSTFNQDLIHFVPPPYHHTTQKVPYSLNRAPQLCGHKALSCRSLLHSNHIYLVTY